MEKQKEAMRGMSPLQQTLFRHLMSYNDVAIALLYSELRPEEDVEDISTRYQQALVGSMISKINVKLKDFGHIIRPGQERRTYRLYTR